MKFDIPKVTRALKLSEYDLAYGEYQVLVWVTPPRKLLDENNALVEEMRAVIGLALQAQSLGKTDPEDEAQFTAMLKRIEDGLVRVFSELWSAGPEETWWSEEEIREKIDEGADRDPKLWPWMRAASMRLIEEYRNGVKKN